MSRAEGQPPFTIASMPITNSFPARLPRTLFFVIATILFGSLGHMSGGGDLPAWWSWAVLAGLLLLPHDLLLRKARHLTTIGLYTALCQFVVHIWLSGASGSSAGQTNTGSETTHCPHVGHCFTMPSAAEHTHHGLSMVVGHGLAAAAVTTAAVHSSRVFGCLLQALSFLFVVPRPVCPATAYLVLPALGTDTWSTQHVPQTCFARGPPR